MNARRLTVSSSHPESRAHHPRQSASAPMPFLRLRGRWLDQAGFQVPARESAVRRIPGLSLYQTTPR